MNTNQPQTPGQHQVPDHRMEELMDRLRQLEMQNTQLRQTVDFVTKGQQKAAPKESAFKPEVEQALVDIIRRELNPFQEQVKNQVGLVYDATDEAKFKLQYSDQKFAKYYDKVEKLRKDMEAQGRWIPREEALRVVYFEETGKKAAPEAAPQAPAQPKFDPYFGTMVDPTTGLPVQQTAAPAPQEQAWPTEPTEQPSQGQWQQPPAQWQQPRQTQTQQQWQQPQGTPPGGARPGHNLNPSHPNVNPFGMPAQGVNQQAPMQHQRQVPTQISLDSSDDDLEMFADKFGDIPL